VFSLYRFPTLDDNHLLLSFSGNKGAHVGLPVTWGPAPSGIFNLITRRFAETLAAEAGVTIDTGNYDKVRLFRAPNSRHPKTGLHKRRLTLDELLYLRADRVRELVREPAPFELPVVNVTCAQAAADWQAAARAVEQEAIAEAQRGAALV